MNGRKHTSTRWAHASPLATIARRRAAIV
jgi:hypothetical protein